MPDRNDMDIARRARTIGVVLAFTMILWMGAQLLGASLGLPPGLVFIFDALALTAFAWALVATIRIWQKRRNERK
ncbi:DUF5337 domain-containing protein [Palleronia sp.]|uniref:DUF5337 domain-containing protein n=1 Tax=Palleronia sp. TaxID=1940284 RepID=UPI0035C861CB